LDGSCNPPECAFDPENAPEQTPPDHDISIVSVPPPPRRRTGDPR
jgi:hypothetical protein